MIAARPRVVMARPRKVRKGSKRPDSTNPVVQGAEEEGVTVALATAALAEEVVSVKVNETFALSPAFANLLCLDGKSVLFAGKVAQY
jgi:hypothetical protein